MLPPTLLYKPGPMQHFCHLNGAQRLGLCIRPLPLTSAPMNWGRMGQEPAQMMGTRSASSSLPILSTFRFFTACSPSLCSPGLFFFFFLTSFFNVFLRKSSHRSFTHSQVTIIISGAPEMVLEESIEVGRYGSGALGVVRRCQLWLVGIPGYPEAGSPRHWRVHAKGKRDGGESTSLLLLVQDSRSLVREQDLLSGTSHCLFGPVLFPFCSCTGGI